MNHIRLLSTAQIPVTALDPDRFGFNPTGRLPLIQRALFWLLRKLKANAHTTSVQVETTEIDTSKILNALMRNASDVERLYHKRARYVVIGARDFAEFCSGPGLRGYCRSVDSGDVLLPDVSEERILRAG